MLVDFGDSGWVPVEAFTVQEYRIGKEVRFATHKGALWTMSHPKTGTCLRIMKRADRKALLSLQEDGQQICQVSLEPISDNIQEAQEKALPIFVGLAESYAQGHIPKDNLREEKDKLLKQHFPDIVTDTRRAPARGTAKAKVPKISGEGGSEQLKSGKGPNKSDKPLKVNKKPASSTAASSAGA
eukprot:15443843-Alexandrium_andersonii.AAC.2